ncbi:MAG: T9SS type A sorting domain-containing protein [Bacteroidota bacterium]|nr:T9SS type A sorting domain-containing protein [Bacteroidota bacterium]
MDNDSLIDFVYRGTLQDTTPSGFQLYTFITEYDPYVNNFKKIWKTQLWKPNGESGIGGYDVGDYDGDGNMDFLATGIWGQVWVVENKGDNDYGLIWKDSIPFVNLFYQTSGDVDNDGKREFFVGATMSNGNWTIMYEADSNNTYSPKFAFHLLSGGSLDEPTYMTVDLDNDNKLELVILSGADLYFFKTDADNSYYLWYYKKLFAKRSIQYHDFTGDGIIDYIISYNLMDNQGRLKFSADIYKATGLSNVNNEPDINLPTGLKLYQNYPNPFNPNTSIKFEISKRELVTIVVYDMHGREIKKLINELKNSGEYTIQWNPANLPSGVYYYQLKTSSSIITKKALLVK